MSPSLPWSAEITWLLAACTLAGLVLGWYFKFRPHWRKFWDRVNGGLDAITGREAFLDHATGKEVEEVLPMTTRLAKVEDAVVLLTEQQAQMTEIQTTVNQILGLLSEHGSRLKSLEDGRLERIVTKAEAAQMFRMVADEHDQPPAEPVDPPKEQP